ncbi:MAG: hypothetical protein WCA21_20045 [Terracidiphilus sp.]
MMVQTKLLFTKCAILTLVLSIWNAPQSITAQTAVTNQAVQMVVPSDLKVNGAAYVPKLNGIVVQLANIGSKAATAYQLNIAIKSGDSVLARTSYAVNLVEIVINNRQLSGSDDSWAGAILPGSIYSDTEALPDSVIGKGFGDGSLTVQAEVAGVVWSDGLIEAEDSSSAANLNRYLNNLGKKERAENAILAIFEAHKADIDIPHKVVGLQRDLEATKPASTKPTLGSSVHDLDSLVGMDPSEFDLVSQNIAFFQSAPDPAAAIEAYRVFYLGRHTHRLTLMRQQAPLPPLQKIQ